ncbi:hypothetical protein [Microcoleus sp. T2B6]|uniref:hypothetical protein n=1 Tax=Microcoleus sp. T2B6 TaxID=3055424 RepID=UPI002FD6BCAE
MPVPQRVNFLVGWASCPPIKGLLRIVQYLSLNQVFWLKNPVSRHRCVSPIIIKRGRYPRRR